ISEVGGFFGYAPRPVQSPQSRYNHAMSEASVDPLVRGLLDFIDASPTPYHAVNEAARRLEAAGFVRLDETSSWQLRPAARVYTTRGGSSVAAFILGERPPHEAGFLLVGSH